MPLVELTKNPIYKKQIAKMINFSDAESHADVINLQDENLRLCLVRTLKMLRIL
jgi:hypothetical protein